MKRDGQKIIHMKNPMNHHQLTATSANPLTRRKFIKATAGAVAGIAAANALPSFAKPIRRTNSTGIQHIVLVMMENRSFDHFLGWLPGAETRQQATYLDSAGVSHPTFPLAPDFQGCSHPDPDHSYEGARVEYNNGACDGWLRAGSNDVFSIGYYNQADLSFLGNAAPAWTVCDHYFSAIMAPTYPNRIYQHAAQTDRLDDSLLPISTLPTIWDRMADRGVSGKYYYSDLPLLALWGAKYLSIANPISAFYDDCAAGTLPQVSFVEPRLIGEAQGLSGDDHPHGDIRNGEAFLNSVYEAITNSPNWRHTLLVINFDEWGGFFEHVPPDTAPIPAADALLGSDGRRGFRVPALVISPWSPRATIAKGLYDHTSVLKMIEWRFGLNPLSVRDSTANNLADVLNLNQLNLDAPQFNVPAGPFGSPCVGAQVAAPETQLLGEMAAAFGFPILQ